MGNIFFITKVKLGFAIETALYNNKKKTKQQRRPILIFVN